ncbi:MAG: DUF4434 domain-containing protein [Bryobacteraceae bacterium]
MTLFSAGTSGSYFPVLGTFLNFYRDFTPELWGMEFDFMRQVDINTIVVVAVGHLQSDSSDPLGFSVAPDGLFYPSNWVNPASRPTTDRLEMILTLADQRQIKVHLGSLQTAADWSDGTQWTALRAYNQRVATEIVQRYGSRHSSLQGWYFTQEIWMNWVKYYMLNSGSYYGTTLMANWVADMKQIDATKTTTAAVVFKEYGQSSMPGMTTSELQTYMTALLQATHLDLMMPQDGIGAGAGAPSLSDLPGYFSAMASAINTAGSHAALWSTTETFVSNPDLSNDRYPPADVLRIDSQVNSIQPYVSGYVRWIFGDDMSPQATYYPVEASALNRNYQSRFKPQSSPNWNIFPLQSYQCIPSPSYPDTPGAPKLSDRTGGGYNGYSLADWLGFRVEDSGGTIRVVGDLGSALQIRSVRALTQSWIASGIYHPRSMTVEVSPNNTDWTTLGTTSAFPSDTQDFAVMWGEVDGFATGRYVRWTFTHTAWLFLAELEVLGSPGAPPPPNVGIALSPASVNLQENQMQQFTANVTGSTNTAVTWNLSPLVGNLSNGLYTAPPAISVTQTVLVQATSQADPTQSARAAVNLTQSAAAPPAVGPMTPASGSGLSRLFDFQAQAGSGNLQWIQILINGTPDASNACLLYYSPTDDSVYLSADNATDTVAAWVGGAVLGTAGTHLSNSQCTLDYENSSVVKSGAAISLNLSLQFAPAWAGAKNVYLAAADAAQQVAWPYVGYWTVQ